MVKRLVFLVVVMVFVVACGDDGVDPAGNDGVDAESTAEVVVEPTDEPMAEMTMEPEGLFVVSSDAFAEGAFIPLEYACVNAGGENVSPPLMWEGAPAGTQSFAIIMDDPDAPGSEPYLHWLVYNIPADEVGLMRGAEGGIEQGENQMGSNEYFGPCPPSGSPHRYFFKLYALDVELVLEDGRDLESLLNGMAGHILAEAVLIGQFER